LKIFLYEKDKVHGYNDPQSKENDF
jgi:hypothetical protein